LAQRISGAIVRYLGKPLTGAAKRFAEEAALGRTLRAFQGEIRALSAQLEARKKASAAVVREDPSGVWSVPLSADSLVELTPEVTHAEVQPTGPPSPSTSDIMNAPAGCPFPPWRTHPFVLCAWDFPSKGRLRARSPRIPHQTNCRRAFRLPPWARSLHCVPGDVLAGRRPWRPRCESRSKQRQPHRNQAIRLGLLFPVHLDVR
jgi:hypothetical protein